MIAINLGTRSLDLKKMESNLWIKFTRNLAEEILKRYDSRNKYVWSSRHNYIYFYEKLGGEDILENMEVISIHIEDYMSYAEIQKLQARANALALSPLNY